MNLQSLVTSLYTRVVCIFSGRIHDSFAGFKCHAHMQGILWKLYMNVQDEKPHMLHNEVIQKSETAGPGHLGHILRW